MKEAEKVAGTEKIPTILRGLPTPKELFRHIWEKVLGGIRAKVIEWVKKEMEVPIAFVIRNYVK